MSDRERLAEQFIDHVLHWEFLLKRNVRRSDRPTSHCWYEISWPDMKRRPYMLSVAQTLDVFEINSIEGATYNDATKVGLLSFYVAREIEREIEDSEAKACEGQDEQGSL